MTAAPQLADLLSDPNRVKGLPPEVIAALRGQLAELDSLLLAKLVVPQNGRRESVAKPPDKLLSAGEAAQFLGVTQKWLYRHAKQLPFVRRLSRKTLRFNEAGLFKWQATKRA